MKTKKELEASYANLLGLKKEPRILLTDLLDSEERRSLMLFSLRIAPVCMIITQAAAMLVDVAVNSSAGVGAGVLCGC